MKSAANSKLLDLWHKIKYYKVTNDTPYEQKKFLIIGNGILFSGAFVLFLTGFLLLIDWVILLNINFEYYFNFYIVGIPHIIFQILAIVCFFQFHKFKNFELNFFIAGLFFDSYFLTCFIFFGEFFYIETIIIFLHSLGAFLFVRNLKYFYLSTSTLFLYLLFMQIWPHYYPPLFQIFYKPVILITKYVLLVFGSFLTVFFISLVSNLYYKSEANLFSEKEKSEKLLLNILPIKIADELKEKGYTKPRLYNDVSVLFTDFVGFTMIAEKLSPEKLVNELDNCFSYFDSVAKKYNLEKIKTIGDSYMCAGGIPENNTTHAIDCVLAALEIQSFMKQMKEIKESQNHPYWELRLGINTGALVAGVVGETKFAYDIWGDTVNTASRMESSGVAGKINISSDTHKIVRHLFVCEHRGKVKAKRKGEIDMYFVGGIRTEYSRDEKGNVPNDRFHDIYQKIKKGKSITDLIVLE